MRKQLGPVDEVTLRGLQARGVGSGLIDLRLQYAEKAQLLNHYIGPAAGRVSKTKKDPWLIQTPEGPRCYPSMLPTQASGRWSTSEPPLATFPPDHRSFIVPDPGWCFVVWDYDAIEAKIVAALSHDQDDLDAFAKGWDLHTLTACGIFGMKRPSNVIDPHTAPECAEWRGLYQWGGKDDRRRHMAKTARYALCYALDHKGILNIKDAEKLAALWGQDPATFRLTLLKIGYDYLKSKPALVARKRQAWESAWRTHQSVTALGRVRPLMGDRHGVMKEGWNHEVQGTASDIMNAALRAIDERWPEEAVLAYQSHDSGTFGFPVTTVWWPEIRQLVEKTYTIAGHEITFTATWYVVPPLGHVCDGRCTPQKCHQMTPEEWGCLTI